MMGTVNIPGIIVVAFITMLMIVKFLDMFGLITH